MLDSVACRYIESTEIAASTADTTIQSVTVSETEMKSTLTLSISKLTSLGTSAKISCTMGGKTVERVSTLSIKDTGTAIEKGYIEHFDAPSVVPIISPW